MSKPPAFQFYPDKWMAGTLHLSPEAYRAYHLILCWMWLHSKTQHTMPDTEQAWKTATLIQDGDTLQRVRDEIMQPNMQLLSRNHETLISVGLKKESSKYEKRRSKAQKGAKARWSSDLRNNNSDATSMAQASPKQCLPTPTPTPTPKKKSKPKKDAFVAPTVEQLAEYIADRKYNCDAQEIWDYYDALDWHKSNGDQIKNWKLCCQTWHKQNKAKQEYASPYHKKVVEAMSDYVDGGFLVWIDKSRAIARHVQTGDTMIPARDQDSNDDRTTLVPRIAQ